MQSAKTRVRADCGSDHELLIANFRLKLKEVEKPLDHSGYLIRSPEIFLTFFFPSLTNI